MNIYSLSLIEPVYPTLLCAFYANVEVYTDLCIICTLRGIEIRLDAKRIFKIARVPFIGLKVEDMKIWPNIPGFVVSEVIQHLCNISGAHGTAKPNAQSLSLESIFLHHIITYSFIPRGVHKDDVSHLEVFLVDSILVRRQINLGLIVINHIMTCCQSTTQVLPYGRFLMKVFKEFGLDVDPQFCPSALAFILWVSYSPIVII